MLDFTNIEILDEKTIYGVRKAKKKKIEERLPVYQLRQLKSKQLE